MYYSGVLFDHVEKNSVKVGSMLCNNCAHVVYCSVCKAVDGKHFVRNLIRSDQAHQYYNKIVIMMDCFPYYEETCLKNLVMCNILEKALHGMSNVLYAVIQRRLPEKRLQAKMGLEPMTCVRLCCTLLYRQ